MFERILSKTRREKIPRALRGLQSRVQCVSCGLTGYSSRFHTYPLEYINGRSWRIKREPRRGVKYFFSEVNATTCTCKLDRTDVPRAGTRKLVSCSARASNPVCILVRRWPAVSRVAVLPDENAVETAPETNVAKQATRVVPATGPGSTDCLIVSTTELKAEDVLLRAKQRRNKSQPVLGVPEIRALFLRKQSPSLPCGIRHPFPLPWGFFNISRRLTRRCETSREDFGGIINKQID